MRTSLGRRFGLLPGITVSQRFTIYLILMVFLATAAVGVGGWSAVSMQRITGVVGRDASLSGSLLGLQTNWQSMVGSINSFSITLPPAEIVQQLEGQLEGYNQILLTVSSQSLEATTEVDAQNQQILQELSQLGVEIRTLADQVYRSIQGGDWIASVQIRQTEMAKLQARFDAARNQLNTNLQEEISAQASRAQRIERFTRNIGALVLILALLISLWFRFVNQRFTFEPLSRIIVDLKQFPGVKSAAEIIPAPALPQRDEVGDLSRALTQMTEWVRGSYETLEERIAERTEGLERRTLQLQVAAEVARDIASSTDLEEMLTRAVNLIRDRFGYYHSGVFLSDERREFEVLRAATGEAGLEMLRRQHKLRIGETGLVGFVGLSGEPRIASDVGVDAVHFKNPLLPETRSEVALPIKAGNRVIGVLDVQSSESAAFDQDSINMIQIIADQLAIAIQNARLFQETQERLSELEKTYGRYDFMAWDRLLQSIPTVGYQYDGMKVNPIAASESTIAKMGDEAEPSEGDLSGSGARPLSLPLRVRGGIIGALDIWPQGEQLSPAETSLLTNISDRLSQIFESARLFEETQARAAREEAINRLTTSFARSLDTESVLQTAVREMAGLPSVVEATILLEAPSETAPDGAKGEGNA